MDPFLASPPSSAPIGDPIPHLPHAISVSLPTWQSNVDWASGNESVVSRMATGYPRFFIQRNIQHLESICLQILQNYTSKAMLFPTIQTAKECEAYLERFICLGGSSTTVKIVHFEASVDKKTLESTHPSLLVLELHAVLYPPEARKWAKSFWQNAGMGISSRYADKVLERRSTLVRVGIPTRSRYNGISLGLEQKYAIRQRITSLIYSGDDTEATTDCNGCEQSAGKSVSPIKPEHVYLYPTGMSAIWHAHQLSLAFKPQRKCVIFGFSYTDTVKVLEHWGEGCAAFYNDLDRSLAELEDYLLANDVAALFCEVPSNPLLQTPNMQRLRELADKYGFLIVVDDTIGTFVNVDILPYTDIITTSLSKLYSGKANVLGGTLVINSESKHAPFMQAHLEDTYMDDYFYEDAIVMEANGRDFAQRVRKTNISTEIVCDFLRTQCLTFMDRKGEHREQQHEASSFVLKTIYYPKWTARENYDRCRRRRLRHPSGQGELQDDGDGNFGHIFSLTFVNNAAAHAFYDALPCAKGPSLGTNFTLSCPYTILAHYNELEWAAQYGVEEGIVRISVGLEDSNLLLGWIKYALCESRKAL